MMRLFALLSAAALLCGAMPAQAQSASNILGDWVFEAPLEMEGGCVITGRARITAERGEGAYAVRISARQTCQSGGDWVSEQQCAATREGAKLSINCTVLSSNSETYVDDDFMLQIRARDAMDGWLLSASNGRAVWRRPPPARIS